MILVCPACKTRYQVEDDAVGRPSGRMVRCADCGHSWRHMPPPAHSALTRLRERVEAVAPPEIAVTPRAAITAPDPPRRRRGSGLGWVALILLIGAAAVGAILGRDRIVASWPAVERAYALVGLKTQPLGVGLDIGNVTTTHNSDGIVIEGDITNKIGVPKDVPHLRVALRDAGKHELIFKIVDPPRDRLLPGETSHFVIGFLPAPDDAVGVLVTFAAG